MRTNIHKSNCLIQTQFQNIDIIATAFKNRIMTYRLNPVQGVKYLSPEDFLQDNKHQIINLMKILLLKHDCIKVNFELFAHFVLPQSSEQLLKSFNVKYEIVYHNTDMNDLYYHVIEAVKRKISEFEHCDSGWSYISISHLEININKHSPMRGGSYLDLPLPIKNSKSCINIKNTDNKCFLWSIVAALHPSKRNVCRMTSYPHYSSVLCTEGMIFPPSFNDIKLFELKNPEISVNVYGLEKKYLVTGPLYMTKTKKENHVNLLYFEIDNKGHYCLIKDLVRLVRRQITQHKGKVYLCEACLQFFTNESKFRTHQCSKILTILPESNSILQFKHFDRKQKIPFVIYADFESVLENSDINTSPHTRTYKVHKPACFAYYICCSYDSTLNKYVTYRGRDCVDKFIELLIEDTKHINEKMTNKQPMKPMTVLQKSDYMNASTCHICGNYLFGDKVRDHDHVTSEYRGAAHSLCNLMLRVCPFIPVIIHNLSGYDSHMFIEELATYKGPIKIIPKSKEKYLTITKTIQSEYSQYPIQIKFIDSFHFLSASLDTLSKSLSDTSFIHLSREFPHKEQFDLLRHKGVYPYDYMDSWKKYDETKLPLQENFYNSLSMEHISEDDYNHALLVWRKFNIRNLGEYTDLYLKSDVLLLCDVFENFRNISLIHYKLDPAYYVTSPSLSWDAMLLYTDVKLELISNLEIYQMLEKGIRGGLAQCSLRHAEANNKYLPHYNDNAPSSYLVYLDCNNLYGYAMTKSYPISDFRFLSRQEIDNLDITNISDDNIFGYILEVDMIYPDHLHTLHSDLPFAAEKFISPVGNSPKLIANLYDKYSYIIHYVHLKECIKNGLILRNIHRVIRFRQDNYLKRYIDLNTELRKTSTNEFEKDFFKLMNNAIFGKTIENKRKQVNVKLVTKWTDNDNITNKQVGAEKLITKPNFQNICIFSENFAAVQLSPEKVILDRPIYIGFAVLEHAKQHLYKFHYDFIKRKYNDNAQLCYTDTDSLLYLIKTHDFYQDISKHLSQFDTSNFSSDNPYHIPRVHAKIPGLFKDEMGGEVISEFIGLRAKLYYINCVKTQIKKAKGTNKSVTKRLALSNYKQALLQNKIKKCKMNNIRSIHHVLYSQETSKVVLSRNDDKRQILQNQIQTLPWGHCETIF